MRSFSVRLAVAAAAVVALAPVSAVHAEPVPAVFKDVPLPFLWPTAGVRSVAAVSDTEAWISGRQGQVGESAGNPVVRHRVGSQWKEYPLNGWSGNGGVWEVVAHGGEVWVRGVQGGEKIYLARFDGTAFQPVALPPDIAYAYYTRLWAGPAGVWLQVEVEGPTEGKNVIALYRRVGNAWQADPVAGSMQDGLGDLQARSATEAWAGGCRYNTAEHRQESVALRWNGSAWTTLPTLPTDRCVISVAPAADGTVWALTWDTLYRWDGQTWTAVPAVGVFEGYGKKVRLDKDGDPLVVLSHEFLYGPAPLLRYTGGAWQTFAVPSETWVHDVSVAPSGRIWVTGTKWVNAPVVLTAP
ncbi:hypothetical protein [Actinomadura sp. GTD37]|uniref:hypothetical protein n=1 Tax=Actinomadura sp. GTD37 TaxID=1778030 RepID=UPI0035C25C36